MEEKCSNCKFYRRLKHDFEAGKGFKDSNCCVVWVKIDDGANSWVQEVEPNDICEMFEEKTDDSCR